MTIAEYYEEFMQDIFARAGAEKNFNESTFTERMCEFLVDQAVIEDYQCVEYKMSSKNLRVDAWSLSDDGDALTLLVTDFRHSPDIESLSRTDAQKVFKRAANFFRECLKARFFGSLEESSPAYALAREIHTRGASVSKVQLVLLSNAELSKRVDTISDSELAHCVCTHTIWDLSRLFRLESSGRAREEMVIEFDSNTNGALPCLPAFTGKADSEAYLIVMPGSLLAQLYDEYGERLLEQNVRTFLQFRGKVNKGIRNTLLNEPEMFFAYNNGLSATAESVVTNSARSVLKSVKNLQIVNGGQTTASIFTSMKKKVDLTNVYVQVKLSVIPSDDVETVVPRISEYANTQNKVNAADFFSNHPFHLRIEGISRRLWAPSPEGSLRETHWFYERTRGQYANAQATLTAAQKREFLAKNPRHQMFTKTDLAKFVHCFEMLPHVVSLGAQKNFAQFATEIGRKWEAQEEHFNEFYYRQLIAKAILFRFLDKQVMKQGWYGGYKANIVAYAIAKTVHETQKLGKHLNLDRMWQEQKVSDALANEILEIAEAVNDRIQMTPDGITNVTEWCKKERCWHGVRDMQIDLGYEFVEELIEAGQVSSRKKDAAKTQKIDNNIHGQMRVLEKGVDYWKRLRKWNDDMRVLSPKQAGILDTTCKCLPGKVPSEKQCAILLTAETKAIEEGFG